MSKRIRDRKKQKVEERVNSSELLRWLVGDSPDIPDNLLLSIMEVLDIKEGEEDPMYSAREYWLEPNNKNTKEELNEYIK